MLERLRIGARSLRCYAEWRDGDWEAICLDLDIAAQDHAFDDVIGSLREAISLYLETVADLSPQERRSLLQRRAPFALRFRFLAHALRGLFAGRDGDRQWRQFTMRLVT